MARSPPVATLVVLCALYSLDAFPVCKYTRFYPGFFFLRCTYSGFLVR